MKRLKLILFGFIVVLIAGFSFLIMQPAQAADTDKDANATVPPGIAKQGKIPGKGSHKGWQKGQHKGWQKQEENKETKEQEKSEQKAQAVNASQGMSEHGQGMGHMGTGHGRGGK